jgi:outer membrane protein OmpA-like peptidoglycan-associated protein
VILKKIIYDMRIMKNHMQIVFLTALLAASLLLLPESAWAQEGQPPDIQSEFELNTFNPASAPTDGFTLDRAQVMESWQFGFGAMIQIDDDPLTWQRKSGDGSYEETKVAFERLIVLHLGAGLGFFNYGQLSVQFPLYIDDGTMNTRVGAGDMRLIPKGAYRFDVGASELGVAVLMPISVPSGDSNRLLGEGKASLAPTLALDAVWGRMRVLLNSGFYYREKEEADLVRGSELFLGLGGELDIPVKAGDLRAIVEAWASTQTEDFFSREGTPSNLLGGIKYRFRKGLGLLAALGAGLTPGVGAPDFRVVFGLDYAFQRADEDKDQKDIDLTDMDGDGVIDLKDKCPNILEDFDFFKDDDGCPESDNDEDGIPDDKDNCPNEPENVNGIDDEDGCLDMDSDSDGVPSARDQCPEVAEDADGFADDDGCPEDDNDLDGINDMDDKCPSLPESFNKVNDIDGCPETFSVYENKIDLAVPVEFKPGTADLKDKTFEVLEDLAAALIANPSWEEMQMSVHTSGCESDISEQQLSEDRALAIMNVLIREGVVPERLVASGKANSEPLNSGTTPKECRQNERVEIQIKKAVEQ